MLTSAACRSPCQCWRMQAEVFEVAGRCQHSPRSYDGSTREISEQRNSAAPASLPRPLFRNIASLRGAVLALVRKLLAIQELAIAHHGKSTIVLLPQRQHHSLSVASRKANLREVRDLARAVDQHALPLRTFEDMDNDTVLRESGAAALLDRPPRPAIPSYAGFCSAL